MRNSLFLGLFLLTTSVVFAMRGSKDVTSQAKYPFQVSIRLWPNNTHHCGGTIHNANHILTSARCVSGWRKEDLAIFVGSFKLSGGTKYDIEEIKISEEYNQANFENDIALVKTTVPIAMQKDVVSEVTFERTSTPELGTVATVIGWTDPLDDPQYFRDQLQELETTIRDRRNCAPPEVFRVNDRQICSANFAVQGVCAGDFGGPLLLNGRRQVGIISFYATTDNDLVCGNGRAMVYTSIPALLWWIEANNS